MPEDKIALYATVKLYESDTGKVLQVRRLFVEDVGGPLPTQSEFNQIVARSYETWLRERRAANALPQKED